MSSTHVRPRPSPPSPPSSDDPAALVRTTRIAAGLAGVMALLYLAIFAGLLSVGRAESGELGVLGVAGVVYAALGVALLLVRRRWLWVAAALFQLPIFAMYVAIAPERDPHYEVWGVTLRVLQLALLVVLVLLARRRR